MAEPMIDGRTFRSLHWAGMWPHLVAWLVYAVVGLVVLWPLGSTNRILAGVDALTYFTPYWSYRMAAFREGSIPLWNPYLFLGAPFLANPQAAVLYPLHWPLSWLTASQALVWSALLHVWLACGLTYHYVRKSLALSGISGWFAGAAFGLGGFVLARIENINQLNALAWLPAMLLLYDCALRAGDVRRKVRSALLLAGAIALAILAGHTQTTFISVSGLLLYALLPLASAPACWLWSRLERRLGRDPRAVDWVAWRRRTVRRLVPLLALLPAVLVCAAQLLPSIELNSVGLRTGGLPYRQAVSFSLRPQLLAQTFLPPFGGGLADAFGSEGYAEFAGYAGMSTLLLALAGALHLGAVRSRLVGGGSGTSRGRRLTLLLVGASGLFLAIGAYNPVYYVLWRLVPGFDLFRAPARWLELYAFGAACLAGCGLDALLVRDASWRAGALSRVRDRWRRVQSRLRAAVWAGMIAFVGALLLAAAIQRWPSATTLGLWLGSAGLAIGLIAIGRRRPMVAGVGLPLLLVGELVLAGRALPFSLATAPYALSMRTAPSAILAAEQDAPAAGRGRLLAMSDIRYDAGDLAEQRSIQADRLSADSVERMARAAKQMEVVAPNLSLYLQLPSVDGYDGGLLPTGSFGALQALLLPPDRLLSDGRLSQQLQQIPAAGLLDAMGVRYVLTDKQNDLWLDDVYYDLEQAAMLDPGAAVRFDLDSQTTLSATAIGLVSYLAGETPAGSQVAELIVTAEDGAMVAYPLVAGVDSDWSQSIAGAVRVARTWPDWMGAGRDYVARIELPAPAKPQSIELRVAAGSSSQFVLRGISLIDARTETHASVTVSTRGDFRRIHSGDVKVYERIDAPGRAWLVHRALAVSSDAEVAALMSSSAFDPRHTALIAGDLPALEDSTAPDADRVTVVEYDPERVTLQVETASNALLVIADADYPGWRATVDGAEQPILRTNLVFRSVPVSAGSHEVRLVYDPEAFRLGAATSIGTLLICLACFVAGYAIPSKQSKHRRRTL